MRLRPFYLAFTVLLLDCATLESFPSGTCGNGVVDATEDCDSFPSGGTGRCGAASDGEAACRLLCGKQPSGETFACPDGWGCSVKGVCRQPSGEFDTALTSVSAGVTNVDVGDFDGDGRKDVLGTGPRTTDNASRVRVHYFDDLGGLAQAVSLPSQLVSPAVVDFDHNGRDDLTFGLSGYAGPGGLGVVSGLPDRRFLSVLFPAVTIGDTEAIPISVRATTDLLLPNGARSSILLFGRSPQGAALSSLEAEVGVGGAQLKRELPVGPEAIRGRPLAARVFDLDTKSTCGEVVAAVEAPEGPRIFVFSPCTYADGPAGRAAKWEGSKARGFDQLVVPKPLGTKGIVLADVNADGHVDLLVDTTEGPYAALNDGTKLSPLFLANVGTVMPRAAADLNRDGVVDFVFDNVVAMSRPPSGGADAGADGGAGSSGYEAVVLETSGTWSDVIIGNFNGDGYPDLVAMRAGSPDVKLYAGSATGAFTPITVTTESVVEQIAKGDFDGDHVDDIALAQTSSVAGSSDLAIAYGRAIGGPEPSRLVGRLAQPQGLVGIPNETGAIDDLGVYTYGTKLPSGLRPTSFTLVVGSGDRQALAPLFYLDQESTRPLKKDAAPTTDARLWVPVAVAPGAFHVADRADVFSYALGITVNARTGELRPGYVAGAWQALADPAAQGGLAPPVEVQAIDGNLQFLDPATRAVNVATTTGDVDNAADHLDEVIVLTNEPRGSGALLQVVQPSKGGPRGAPLSVPDLRIAPGAQLQLVDVDGDGLRDAVGVFGPRESAQVVVLLNDGNGSFAARGIPVPIAASSSAKAFAAVTVGGAPALGAGRRTRSLAVVTERGVSLATLRADRSGFDVRDLAAQLGAKGLASGTGIASGDFNGDGVDDLAIADAGSVRLVLQIPARQR